LDFYGTLVHEDDAVVASICEEVRLRAPDPAAVTAAEISRYWWSEYLALMGRAHGRGFLTQRAIGRTSLAAVLRRFRSGADLEALLAAQFAYWGRPEVHPDALPFLAYLAEAGLPTCVVSNIDRADLEAAMAHHGLAGRFTHLVTSEDARSYKPRPEMFGNALGLLGLAPGDVLHIGDSLANDVAGATALGIPVAWINRRRRTQPSVLVPTHEATALTGLLALLAPASC